MVLTIMSRGQEISNNKYTYEARTKVIESCCQQFTSCVTHEALRGLKLREMDFLICCDFQAEELAHNRNCSALYTDMVSISEQET